MSRDRAVGGIGKPPFPQAPPGFGMAGPPDHRRGRTRPATRPRFPAASLSPPATRRPCPTRDRAAQRRTARPASLRPPARAPSDHDRRRRDDPIARRKAGRLPREPRFHEVRDGQIDIVAAQQDMFAHRHAPDVGDRALTAFGRSSNKLKSEVPPPISMTSTCRGSASRSSSPATTHAQGRAVPASNRTQPAAPRAVARRSGKPASSAAAIVSRCAPASKEAGTVIVIS